MMPATYHALHRENNGKRRLIIAAGVQAAVAIRHETGNLRSP